MKASKARMGAALLAAALFAGPVHAQIPDFMLINDTGYTIYSVFVWPTSSRYQGVDQLGDQTLATGDSFYLTPRRNAGCEYDLKITLENSEREQQWSGIDLCGLNAVTIHYHGRTGMLWATSD